MEILDAIRARHAGSLISDNRRLDLVTSEDQLWIRDTWVPLAVDEAVKWAGGDHTQAKDDPP